MGCKCKLGVSSKPQPICFRKTEVAANPSALLISYKELRQTGLPIHPSLMQMDEIALVLAALPWPLKEVEMVASNSGAANAMESQS